MTRYRDGHSAVRFTIRVGGHAQWQEVPFAILNDDDFRDFIFELNLMIIAGGMWYLFDPTMVRARFGPALSLRYVIKYWLGSGL
ncbi:hypothetical protein CFP56_024948 [Quercus suber]|uniref:Uncharacterized protein n=1 Tax=Quercus suber TaxID=58331 RepID=A0AAW0LXL1_QUESU